VSPNEVTGRTNTLPTTIDEGIIGLGGQNREMLSGSGMVWFNAPESTIHSISEGGVWSHAKASRMEMRPTVAGWHTSAVELESVPRVA
jgi:hypothetical protein